MTRFFALAICGGAAALALIFGLNETAAGLGAAAVLALAMDMP